MKSIVERAKKLVRVLNDPNTVCYFDASDAPDFAQAVIDFAEALEQIGHPEMDPRGPAYGAIQIARAALLKHGVVRD